MKSHHCQLAFVLLLGVVGCNALNMHNNQQLSPIMAADTLFASRIDSLEWVIKSGTEEQITDAISQLDEYRKIYPEIVFKHAKNLYITYAKSANTILRGKIASTLGGIYYESGIIDSALIYFNESVSFFEKSDHEEYLAFAQIRLGHVQRLTLEYDKAIDNLLKSLAYFERDYKPNRILSIYNHIALVYETMGNLDKQEEYLLKALDFSKKEDVPKDVLGSTLINFALLKANQQDYEESVALGTKAIDMFRQAGQSAEVLLGLALQRMVFVLFVADKTDHIKSYLDEAFGIAERTQNLPLKADVLLARVRFHLDISKDYQAAYHDAKRAEMLMDTTNQADLDFLYYQLTRSAIGMNNREECFKYLNLYSTANLKKQNNILAQKSSEIEIKYETAKKEHEIAQQQLIISKQNTLRLVLIAGITLCIIILALLWYMLHLRNRRNRALAEMNATKDKFFSIISHDLKNPALAQRDALQLLVKNAHTWDTDTLTEYYHELLKSAEGEVELVYHLLNWAQLQTGRMTYTPTTFNLLARLRPDLSLIRKMAENKKITFHVQIPDDLIITADSDMIATIIRNLLNNAIKFTSTSGEVSLLAERPINNDTGVLLYAPTIISITDTGTGMSQEQISNLFRIDRHQLKGMAHEQNTGLGLIVCQELLEKHGSALHVESEMGKGSKFWFTIKQNTL